MVLIRAAAQLGTFLAPEAFSLMEALVSPTCLGFYSICNYRIHVKPLNGHPPKSLPWPKLFIFSVLTVRKWCFQLDVPNVNCPQVYSTYRIPSYPRLNFTCPLYRVHRPPNLAKCLLNFHCLICVVQNKIYNRLHNQIFCIHDYSIIHCGPLIL